MWILFFRYVHQASGALTAKCSIETPYILCHGDPSNFYQSKGNEMQGKWWFASSNGTVARVYIS